MQAGDLSGTLTNPYVIVVPGKVILGAVVISYLLINAICWQKEASDKKQEGQPTHPQHRLDEKIQ